LAKFGSKILPSSKTNMKNWDHPHFEFSQLYYEVINGMD